jgi:type II secretory pathway pseudopilin PulG
MAIIDKPSDYFNTVLYTGNGGTQSITSLDFQPDWVWIKCRNRIEEHVVFDVIRGATKKIYPNLTSAESTEVNTLTSFNSDGFSLGSAGLSNSSGDTFASWNWKANGTGVANTDGSISSTVSANTTSGFSVITFTGDGNANATVGHGLGVAPKMVIVKSRSAATGWFVYHASLTTGDNIYLDDTGAAFGGSYVFDVTSTVFKLRDHTAVNGNGVTFVAYCFADTSMSKMGSYTGNGNADGTFVYTGFKPAFLLVKKSSASGSDWNLHNNKSPGFNVNDNYLAPNEAAAEVTNNSFQIFDLLSNGFKCRGTGTGTNASGETIIYMAFAENPFVTSTAIPACAR